VKTCMEVARAPMKPAPSALELPIVDVVMEEASRLDSTAPHLNI
jgi:hypothetical protein